MKRFNHILNWYAENGVIDFVHDNTIDHYVLNQKKDTKNKAQKITSNNSDFKDEIKSQNMDEIVKLLALKHSNNKNSNVETTQDLITPEEAVKIAREISDKASSLEELKDAIENFNGCYSIKRLATNTVFGEGNPQANILIIGEAPNNDEDLEGKPFCGQNGTLLDKMFNAIGHKREDLYTTNTLFWRPPGNRTPTPEEIAMCKPFVEKHIALINPKIIIIMGSTAFRGLLNTDTSSVRERGKFFDYNNPYLKKNIKATPLFHPSYLLKQPTKKADAWKDLLIIKDFLEKLL